MSNYTIWGVFGPATWPWWFAAASLLVMSSRRTRRAAPWLLAVGVACFVGLAILPTGTWLAEPLEQRFARPALRGLAVDHIVVLAGAERLAASARSGRPEVGGAAERIIEGARLARLYPEATLWIAGGVRDPRSPMADIAWTAMTWRELGIDAPRIALIDGTLDTCRNAAGFAERRTTGVALLVTSALHMPRAVGCFRAQRSAVIPYPVDFQNDRAERLGDRFSANLLGNITRADAALHEWIGLAVYRASGRIETLFPGERERPTRDSAAG